MKSIKPEPAHRNEFVQSLATGLKVLETFTNENRQQTLTEVAERADITRATARRMLLTLTTLGYLHLSKQKFEMTSKTLAIGHKYWAGRSLSDVLLPVLNALSEDLNSSCSAAILDGDEVVYVARINRSQLMRLDLHPGSRLPALHTSMGRNLVAHLPATDIEALLAQQEVPKYTEYTVTDISELRKILVAARREEHAWVNQELEYGFGSAAVPVRDAKGHVVLAINTSMRTVHEGRFSDLDYAIPRLKTAAASIEELFTALDINVENAVSFF